MGSSGEFVDERFIAGGQFSSVVVESLKNVAKVAVAEPYGFRNYERLKFALCHSRQADGAETKP